MARINFDIHVTNTVKISIDRREFTGLTYEEVVNQLTKMVMDEAPGYDVSLEDIICAAGVING